nr:DUF3365 domain-containing protein [Salinibacter sp.]
MARTANGRCSSSPRSIEIPPRGPTRRRTASTRSLSHPPCSPGGGPAPPPHSGHEGWRYAHRITVQPSCLACHAPKDERPAFVKKDHPEDRAYGFDDGDLQGVHAVFVPDTSGEDEF